jgi:hypothetical protein
MTDHSRSAATIVLLDDEPAVWQFATCPMCRTTASLTQSALEAGDAWQCVRCGQHWDAVRLGAVAAYGAWVLERDADAKRVADRAASTNATGDAIDLAATR